MTGVICLYDVVVLNLDLDLRRKTSYWSQNSRLTNVMLMWRMYLNLSVFNDLDTQIRIDSNLRLVGPDIMDRRSESN